MVPKAHGEIELGARFLACALGALQKSYVYPDGPSAYWTDFDSFQVDAGWRMAGDICLAVAAYSGDQLMVWRLYVIWSRNKHVLYIPALAATLGAAGVVSVISYDVLCVRDSAFLPQHRAVSIAVFGITIISTWYSTILICAKIWSVDRERRRLQQSSPSRYGQIIWVMIQSGTLYSLTLGAWLICTLVNDAPATSILHYLNIRVVGLNSTLILLQTNADVLLASNDRSSRNFNDSLSIPVFRRPRLVRGHTTNTGEDELDTELEDLPFEGTTCPNVTLETGLREV
ncbi:hypothetical protein FRB96_007545 [Tulasnella sp. 330]|nr:hypothetical protein FRB96_007545 [Tulasnella sp. 330]